MKPIAEWDWQADAARVAEIFDHAGYDAQLGDQVTARRERGSVREIFLDRSGQLRCVETATTRAPHSKRVTQDSRTYRLLIEHQRITQIMVKIESVDALTVVLHDFDAIFRKGGAAE